MSAEAPIPNILYVSPKTGKAYPQIEGGCDQEFYCKKVDSTLSATIEVALHGPHTYRMDTPQKQNLYKKMLSEGDAIIENGHATVKDTNYIGYLTGRLKP